MRVHFLIAIFFCISLEVWTQKPSEYWPFEYSMEEYSMMCCMEAIDFYDLNDSTKVFSTYDLRYSISLNDTSSISIFAPQNLQHLLSGPILKFAIFSDSVHYSIELMVPEMDTFMTGICDSLITEENADLIGWISMLKYLETADLKYFDIYESCWLLAPADTSLVWLNGFLKYWGVLAQRSALDLVPFEEIPIIKCGFRSSKQRS